MWLQRQDWFDLERLENIVKKGEYAGNLLFLKLTIGLSDYGIFG